jgi:hypothetical protein
MRRSIALNSCGRDRQFDDGLDVKAFGAWYSGDVSVEE